MIKSKVLAAVLAAGVGILSSCQKNTVDKPASNLTTVPEPKPADDKKLKDSVLLLTRDIYLWYNQIPSNFDAQSFATPDETMTAIRQYGIEPGFSATVDRWSFAMKKTEWDNMSTGHIQEAAEETADLGLNVFFRTEGELMVRNVEPESAAGKAGIRRGWRITGINGNSNMTTGNSTFIVDAVYGSKSSTFNLRKPDGSTVNLTLNANNYTEQPVVLDSVYTAGTKKANGFTMRV